MGTFLFLNRKNAVIKKRNVPICFSNGQGIIEYVILIAVVSAALLGMQVYMQRGIQAVARIASDEVGSQVDSLEDADKSANTTSGTEEYSTGTTRSRELLGGIKRTDFDQASDSVSTGFSESTQDKD